MSCSCAFDVTVVGFESVSVPAGRFDDALHQRTVITQTVRASSTGQRAVFTSTSDDWYAAGIGPVRSLSRIEGEGQGAADTSEEVLLDYPVGASSNDAVAPTVVSRSPAEGSVLTGFDLRLEFSEDIEPASIGADALSLTDPQGQRMAGRMEWRDAHTLVFQPQDATGWISGVYTVRLDGAPEDWHGNRLAAPVQRQFTFDRRAPMLVDRIPAYGAQEVATGMLIRFMFDEDVRPMSGITFALVNGPEGQVRDHGDAAATSAGRGLVHRAGGAGAGCGRQHEHLDIDNRFTTARGPAGRFAFPQTLPAFTGMDVGLLRVADLDRDGHDDLLIVMSKWAEGRVEPAVVRGLPGGGFAATPVLVPNDGGQPAELSVADVDADGWPNVLGARSFGGALWMRQTGANAWAIGGRLGFSAQQLRAIRLVGQQRPGILALGAWDPRLLLLRPNGPALTLGFAPPEVLQERTNTTSRLLQVTDLDGDGREDFVVATGVDGRILIGTRASHRAADRPARFDSLTRLTSQRRSDRPANLPASWRCAEEFQTRPRPPDQACTFETSGDATDPGVLAALQWGADAGWRGTSTIAS